MQGLAPHLSTSGFVFSPTPTVLSHTLRPVKSASAPHFRCRPSQISCFHPRPLEKSSVFRNFYPTNPSEFAAQAQDIHLESPPSQNQANRVITHTDGIVLSHTGGEFALSETPSSGFVLSPTRSRTITHKISCFHTQSIVPSPTDLQNKHRNSPFCSIP